MAGFLFGGDTGVKSAAELARKREIVNALLDPSMAMPQTFGEGLTVLGRAIAGKVQDKRLGKQEDAERARVTEQFSGLTGAAPQAPAQGGYGGGPSVPVPPPDPNSPHALGGDAMAALGKPPISTKADPASIKAGLVARGLPEHVAEGFVMNFKDESGLNPGINEANPIVPGSRGGFGLYQLTGPRRRAYEAYAAERGVPVDDVDAQLDFLMGELQGSEARAAGAILSTKTPGEAGAAIVNEFLRPAEAHRASRSAAYLGGGGSAAPAPAAPAAPTSSQAIVAQLTELAGNPYATDAQKAVAAELLKTEMAKMTPPDPMDALALEKAQLELEQARTPEAVDPFAGTKLIGDVLYGPDGQGGFVPLIEPPSAVGARPLTDPAERAQWGIPPTDTRPYAIEAGKPPQVVGGAGVTVNNNMGGGKFEEEFAKGDAATIGMVYDTGLAAQRNLGRIDQLGTILSSNPTGLGASLAVAAGEWGIPTEGLDELQTAQAIISALVPEQRQPGSGPMSDADLALFKQSLPRIIGQPEGNKLIIDTMRGIAEYDAEGARIVQKLRNEEMTRAEAFEALMNRKNPLADLGKGGGIGGVAETLSDDVPEGVDPTDWQFMTPEEKALFK